MSELLKALESRVSAGDWKRMAQYADVSADELKAKVLTALQDELESTASLKTEQAAIVAPFPVLSDVEKSGECYTQDFEISLYKIVGLKGSLTLCADSSFDWSAELNVCLVVAGASVWCISYKFDPHNLGVCFEPNVGVAKAKLCFNIETKHDKVCLNLDGKACVLGFFGWNCESFDTTLFCIPLP